MADSSEAVVNAAKPEDAVIGWGEKLFKEMSSLRYAEERSWFESALFYQNKQWLTWEGQGNRGRWKVIQQNRDKPKPMPVSNYFANAINSAANSLGAKLPETVAIPRDDDDQTKQASKFAEAAAEEIDRESFMDVQNPLLGKHVAMFGTGVVVDMIDDSEAGESPDVETAPMEGYQCMDCGAEVQDPNMPCPECGSQNIEPVTVQQPVLAGIQQTPKYKIRSEVRPIFEVYVLRDCIDPNLSEIKLRRFRKPLDWAKNKFPGKEFGNENTSEDQAQYYVESLRSLAGYNAGAAKEMVTFTEVWAKWNRIPKDVQAAVLQLEGMDAGRAQQLGVVFTYGSGQLVDAKAKPDDLGRDWITFYQWEKDPGNPYAKGLAEDLKPLQKQLNRIDSLMESGLMSNAAGKWIWPRTQGGQKPTGSPSDVVEWDPIGDGKVKPEFVVPTPFHQAVVQRRQSIIADFQRLSLTEGVQQGSAPEGVTAFRAVAYLGEKAEQQIATQRFLWEQAHNIRKEKALAMAVKFWDEPRQLRVAGFNGKSSVSAIQGKQLEGNYDLDFVPGSSRKKSDSELLESAQIALEAGLIDPTESQTKDFLLDRLQLEGVNASDHLQYEKAQRDLEVLLKGGTPVESPFMKWDIPLKVISQFTFTEEFEGLDPMLQQNIVEYAQYISDKLTAIKMNSQPVGSQPPVDPMQQAASALGGGNPLDKVPGKTTKTPDVEKAAEAEGQQVAKSIQ